jgi:hypothetical protein
VIERPSQRHGEDRFADEARDEDLGDDEQTSGRVAGGTRAWLVDLRHAVRQ